MIECPKLMQLMKETLEKLSILTGIEIPESEFVEAPALSIPTTAQIVDEAASLSASANAARSYDD